MTLKFKYSQSVSTSKTVNMLIIMSGRGALEVLRCANVFVFDHSPLNVSPAMNWQPVHGVPRLLPNSSLLQSPSEPCMDGINGDSQWMD